MARPSSTPRLADLNPDELADEIVRMVEDHVVSQIMRLDMTAIPPKFDGPPELRFSARLLVAFAQVGLRATDWPEVACAMDAIQSVCEALYSCAGEPTFGGGILDTKDLDPREPIDIVLLAAHARVRIAERGRVPVRELACLAGVDPDHVRLLGRKGEIEIVDGEVRSAECRRWLTARGVEGL